MKTTISMILAATALSVLLTACGGGSGSTPSATSLASQEQAIKPETGVKPDQDSSIAFNVLSPAPANSRVMEERVVTVRDAAAWEKLWQEHAPQTFAVQPPPAVDFSRNMVTAVFLGSRSPCGSYAIDSVRHSAAQSRIEITYSIALPAPDTACIALAYFPVFFVEMPRSDEPVVALAAPVTTKLSVERIATGVFTSAIADKRFVVVKDSAAWSSLWQEHIGSRPAAPLPSVDFTQRMVLAVFLGRESVTCGSMSIDSVVQRSNPDRLEAQYRVVDPGPNVTCVAANVNQSSFVSVPASALPVEFVRLR
jgi:hypothetical protein